MGSRKFLVAVVLTVLATVAAAQDRMVIEGILVRVNDRIITISDFTKRLQVEITQMPTAPTEEEIRQLIQTLLDEMVDEMVLLERAAEKNIEVNEKMVDQALQNLREENNLLEDEAWEAAVESSGLTMEQLRERYRRTIMLQRAVQGEVRPLEITEEELRRLYEQQIEQYAVPEKVVLEQVFISDEGSSSGDTVRRAERDRGQSAGRCRPQGRGDPRRQPTAGSGRDSGRGLPTRAQSGPRKGRRRWCDRSAGRSRGGPDHPVGSDHTGRVPALLRGVGRYPSPGVG